MTATVPLAASLVDFLGSWEKQAKDQNILQKVKGYQIPSLCRPKQKQGPKGINFSMQQKAAILLEMKNILNKVENILNKDIVKQVCSQKVNF